MINKIRRRAYWMLTLLWWATTASAAVGDKIYPADNVIYEVTSASEVKIVGYTSAFSITNWNIPRSIESEGISYTVSAIDKFINNTIVQTITIPSSVKAMTTNWQGFKGCTNLQRVTFENGFTTLAKGAFQNCTALTEVILPQGVTEIPTYTFQATGLQRIKLPASVTSINSNAFVGCNNLTEISFEGNTPPTFITNSGGKSFATVILSVPTGQIAAFQAATTANPFQEIRENNTLGINTTPIVWNPITDIRKDDFWVYIIFGQSNAEGYDAIPTSADKQPHADLYNLIAYDNNAAEDGMGATLATWGEWENMAEPNCRKTKYNPTKMGWAKAFGEEMLARNPGKKIAVVHVAVAGSSIKLFDKAEYAAYLADPNTSKWIKYKTNGAYAGNPYQRIIEAAKKAQTYGTIKAILMHQGEEDGNRSYWPTMVKKVYQDMLTDLSLSTNDVPLILGEPTAHLGTIANQEAITTSGNTHYIPNSYLIEATDLAYNGLHFTRDGYVELGKRYAEKATILAQSNNNAATSITIPYHTEQPEISIKQLAKGIVQLSSNTPLTHVKVVNVDGRIIQQQAINAQTQLQLHLPTNTSPALLIHCSTATGTKTLRLVVK